MKIRKLKAATALGSLTASVALLSGVQAVHAQGAPGAGSFPNSFLVPGSQTSFRVGGYMQLLYAYDFGVCTGALSGSGPGNFVLDANGTNKITGHLESVTGNRNHGCSDFGVGTSRFNIETRTPTAFGELKTFLNVDFQSQGTGKTNSDRMNAQMREAYGTLGPWLFGQTTSNFRDASVEAEVIDNGGTTATGPLRLPQIRYTMNFGNGLTLAVAAENSQTKVLSGNFTGNTPGGSTSAGDATAVTNLSDKIPDFSGKLQYDAPWGHINLRAVFSDLIAKNGGGAGPANVNASAFGWGVGVAGTWNVGWGKDALSGAAQYGDGAGRYIGGSGSPQVDAVLSPGVLGSASNNTLHTLVTWQIQANYAHWWTDQLRTNILGSYYQQENKRSNYEPSNHFSQSATFSQQFSSEWYSAINLIWSPVPQVDLGIEYAYSRGKLESGQRGDQSRINAEATFRF